MFERILEKAGLSKAETEVYVALIRLGSSSTGAIIKETGLRKSTVYESIGRLMEKGLVSYVIKNNVKFFESADPERILDFVESKRQELDAVKKNIKKIIPDLKNKRNPLKPHAEAHVMIGLEGFKTMRKDVLKNAKGDHLLLGSISREAVVLPHFWKYFNRERMKLGIKMRILHQQSTKEKPIQGKMIDMRFLPKDITIPSVINIYGDRVVNILWNADHPICFMLINQEIANSYRKYFEILWKISSKRVNK